MATIRKSVIPVASAEVLTSEEDWLEIAPLAQVEVTSEHPDHPIEAALGAGSASGWRAGASGAQTVRLRFDKPQEIRRIRLRFVETQHARRQEFVLRSSTDGRTSRDIVRQQWNFSPTGSTVELEDYVVDLSGVAVLELCIIPDVSGGDAPASLSELRVG